jgi:S1-C subfamily serine protease
VNHRERKAEAKRLNKKRNGLNRREGRAAGALSRIKSSLDDDRGPAL